MNSGSIRPNSDAEIPQNLAQCKAQKGLKYQIIVNNLSLNPLPCLALVEEQCMVRGFCEHLCTDMDEATSHRISKDQKAKNAPIGLKV